MDQNNELLRDFIAESTEHLDNIEEDILALEKMNAEEDKELINKVFRAIHTIKGGCGFLGLDNLSDISHKTETILSAIREGELKPDSIIIDILLESVDWIKALFDDIDHSNETNISAILSRLDEILTTLEPDEFSKSKPIMNYKSSPNTLKTTDFSSANFNIERLENNSDQFLYLYILNYDLIENPADISTIKKSLEKSGLIIDDIKSDKNFTLLFASNMDEDLISMAAGLDGDNIQTVTKDQLISATQHPDQDAGDTENIPTKEINIPTTPAAINSTPKPDQQISTSGIEKDKKNIEYLRIRVDLLDRLMALAGELVLVRNRQLLITDKVDSEFKKMIKSLDVVTSDLQESIMHTRMQPVSTVFNKYQRIVRDLAKKLNKKIDIQIIGNEVELDKTILESLTDPLTHLIRNSCDHGIENPDDRIKAGKNENGTIVLKAFHEGSQINISISDDGKGIDPEKITAKVIEKGLKSAEELKNMTKKDILSLIFMPGFSTSDQISDVSGRGVGMDVVKTSIERVSGIIDIDSAPGEGTTISLQLPLTLAIMLSLIVEVNNEYFIIPQHNLEELVRLHDKDIIYKMELAGNKTVYRLRDSLLTIVECSEVLKHHQTFSSADKYKMTEEFNQKRKTEWQTYLKEQGEEGTGISKTFAVVKIGAIRYGLMVDRVIGAEEIVVNPLHEYIQNIQIFSGSTVLGDGKVATILDVLGIARHAGLDTDDYMAEKIKTETTDETDHNQWELLLFKCGGEEQFAIPLNYTSRVQEVTTSKIQRISNKELFIMNDDSIEILRIHKIYNLEVRPDKAEMYMIMPKNKKIKAGLLASEIIDLGSFLVNLQTENRLNKEWLGTSIINNKVTIFLDPEKIWQTNQVEITT